MTDEIILTEEQTAALLNSVAPTVEQAPVPEMPEHLKPLLEKCHAIYEGLTPEQQMLVRVVRAETTAEVWALRAFNEYGKIVKEAQISALQKEYDAGFR